MWNTSSNTPNLRAQEREEREKGTERTFKEIWSKSFKVDEKQSIHLRNLINSKQKTTKRCPLESNLNDRKEIKKKKKGKEDKYKKDNINVFL